MNSADFIFDPEEADAPLDDATIASIKVAQDQVRRGHTFTADQVLKNAEDSYQAWLQAQSAVSV